MYKGKKTTGKLHIVLANVFYPLQTFPSYIHTYVCVCVILFKKQKKKNKTILIFWGGVIFHQVFFIPRHLSESKIIVIVLKIFLEEGGAFII